MHVGECDTKETRAIKQVILEIWPAQFSCTNLCLFEFDKFFEKRNKFFFFFKKNINLKTFFNFFEHL